MRLRIYLDGQPAWSENVPSEARIYGVGGHAIEPLSGARARAGTDLTVRAEKGWATRRAKEEQK